ncbi:MAG: hypothetical protein HY318_07155 [Armatimonadetes bacterium]|nr:hypothetical protein [Armatimonadota bacterium]
MWQHDNPQRQPLLYEHDLWIMFGCFWMESVLDREQVFRTGPHRGFGHEGFNGWKTDTAVWVLPEPVLHQPHFSEPTWAHVHPVREEIWKRFGPQPPVPRPDNAQSDRWRVDD